MNARTPAPSPRRRRAHDVPTRARRREAAGSPSRATLRGGGKVCCWAATLQATQRAGGPAPDTSRPTWNQPIQSRPSSSSLACPPIVPWVALRRLCNLTLRAHEAAVRSQLLDYSARVISVWVALVSRAQPSGPGNLVRRPTTGRKGHLDASPNVSAPHEDEVVIRQPVDSTSR